MRYTNIFPNPVDDGFLRFTIDSNPKHFGYSEHIEFDPKTHQQWIQGKWDLKDGEFIIRFVHIRERRTMTVVKYQENNKFSCKIDDVDAKEGDYHIEVNGKRVKGKEHIQGDKNLHPALFCLLRLLDELVEIKDENIPAYFFFGDKIEKSPDILSILIKNKPKDVNFTRYYYTVAFLASEYVTKYNLLNKWKKEHLLPAIEQVNEILRKKQYIEIPWTDEQRIFPIPVAAPERSQIILESTGNKKPKVPKFLSHLIPTIKATLV